MVRIIFLFILAGSLLSFSSGSENILEIDFGRIPPGEVIERTIPVEGEVISLVPLCDCLSLSAGKENGRNFIKVNLNPAEYKGRLEVGAIVLRRNNVPVRIILSAWVE
ncbi:MAG: hypothetical protein ABH858_01220 [Candidatus Omnitrophota bacterium]